MTHYYPAIKSPIFNVSIRFACSCCCRLVRATGRSEINQVLLSWPHTLPHKYQITQTHAHIQTWNSAHSTEWTGYIYSYIHIYIKVEFIPLLPFTVGWYICLRFFFGLSVCLSAFMSLLHFAESFNSFSTFSHFNTLVFGVFPWNLSVVLSARCVGWLGNGFWFLCASFGRRLGISLVS